jgi:protein-S-isoprenylcysteine O-methyltransferase Ste14
MTKIAVLLFSAGYFALAVLARGGLEPFLTEPPLIVLAIVTAVLVVVAPFSRGNLSAGKREDRANRWVIPVLTVLGVLATYASAYSDRVELLTVDGDTVRWLGVALYAVGGALRLWPVFVLGHRFSGLVAIQENHALVTGGIYRVIRHPSYLGLLMNGLGWALAFRSLIGVLLAAALIWPVLARIRAEERLLASEFGAEYDAYRAHTWRLIPGVY